MSPSPRMAVLGGNGFIGSHVVAYGRNAGMDVTPLAMARVNMSANWRGVLGDAAAQWRRAHRGAFDDLCRSLAPFDVVVNAAGDPRATSTDSAQLRAANAVLPAVVAWAAHAAGVRRLVHVSTAAVQGRVETLNETTLHFPLSPYASSKAEGERYLLEAQPERGEVTSELVVYRPASVQATRHHATRAFARVVARLPIVPVVGSGQRPVPVALLDNVAAGILFAATMDEPAPIILQPDEGMTVEHLVDLFGARRVMPLPPRAANIALDQLGWLTQRSAYLTSRFRWLELLLRGQATNAKVLTSAGFTVPVGIEGWQALAEAERAHLQETSWQRRTMSAPRAAHGALDGLHPTP